MLEPDLDFTRPMSEELIEPLIVTSDRKLELLAFCPDRDLVWPMSELFTD